MAKVAPIRLSSGSRVLWFDPGDLTLTKDQDVVVETARGLEFATMADDIIDVPDEAVENLSTPIKPVVRVADEVDVAKAAELKERSAEALPLFKELAAKHCPDMHPVSVEFLLDETKAVFYFESEERVDFRSLVRELASTFHIRVDMHQIGARDKARMVGGIGHCGQVICCRALGGQFNPVSIRMAKDQDLSLNPTKISGLCGRLMCCLRYESDVYKDFRSRAPKMGATVTTPAGPAKVVGLDALKEVVTLSLPDEPPIKVDLAGFSPAEEGKRPKVVSEQGWQEALDRTASLLHGRLATVDLTTPQLDKTSADDEKTESAEAPKRPSRRRGRRGRGRDEAAESKEAAKPSSNAKERGGSKSAHAQSASGAAKERPKVTRRKRPKSDQSKAPKTEAKRDEAASGRRARRTTTLAQEGAARTDSASRVEKPAGEGAETRRPRPRPGRRSSGLRAPQEGGDGPAKPKGE